MTILRWLRTRDANLSALRRSSRAALVMPVLFALYAEVVGDANAATFAAFGSMSLLIFVDFGGQIRDRVLAQGSLVLAGAVLICLGTLAAQRIWLAVPAMFLVSFAVLFSAVVSSVFASATTALLVTFVLPVNLPGAVSAIPDRLLGWLTAGLVSMIAIAVLWPAPTKDPLRLATARTLALQARTLRTEVARIRAAQGAPTTQINNTPPSDAQTADAQTSDAQTADPEIADDLTDSAEAVADLRRTFFSTPYRPTGLSTATRTLVRLIDQILLLQSVLEQPPLAHTPGRHVKAVCEVKLAAATLLDHGATVLGTVGDPATLDADLAQLRKTQRAMEEAMTSALPLKEDHAEFVTSLEPGFRAQEMAFAISEISENLRFTVAARRRTWWQHVAGSPPPGAGSVLASAQDRAGAHVERHSVWLHNSVRGAAALALAVLVADLTGVGHSFWVVLGTLSVLRSNALTTGQNVVRALAGTVVGILIGVALIFAVGSNTMAFWFILPIAVLFAGLAPAAISFAAGQAAFSVVILILFSLIQPAGWELGLVRIEDVALGAVVSLVIGVVFWPRGAVPALRQALSEALSDSARYLGSSVAYAVSRCDALAPRADRPTGEAREAAASARRLDDAFRGFLTERGTKQLPLAEVTALISAVALIRLTAESILDLWRDDQSEPGVDRTAARAEIIAATDQVLAWDQQAAQALAGPDDIPAPLTPDHSANARLVDAVRRDLGGAETAVAVRLIWTADHLDAIRRLQQSLSAPAEPINQSTLAKSPA
ncbi:fusaric acid resistance family protein [Kribbella orskensis]|uniref:Fusaric acid resistance family protein n=1 Tax=Kribbella orskensis TaxID=2512216 RepID=A0ABY2BWK7_9ACTN|nr:FUSC family protein [Kribbella orskensis]TCO32329.1 fusaric acid resistance family protein [Kribbella orskensis]